MNIIDVKNLKELPDFYLLFINDAEQAVKWINSHTEALTENKIRVTMPIPVMYRYNGTLAIPLEVIT